MRSHGSEDIEQAGACGVGVDAAQKDLGLPMTGAKDEPGGGARDVAGHAQGERIEARDGAHGDGRRVDGKLGSHGGEHALAVVARAGWFGDAAFAFGIEPGEEDGGLHLGAGDGAFEADTAKVAAFDDERREAVSPAGGNRGAHAPQGRDQAGHGPRAQRFVPGQDGEDGVGSEQAGKEAHGRAAIAAIEDVVAFEEAVQAAALHDGAAAARRPVDRDAECGQAAGGGTDVGGLERPLDAGLAAGDGVEDQGAMGD